MLYRAVDRHARTAAVAKHVADAIVETGVPRRTIVVIPNGVEVPFPRRLATPDRTARIGLLGRLDPQKGADIFLEAAGKVGGGATFVLGAPGVYDAYGEEPVAAARAAMSSS